MSLSAENRRCHPKRNFV